MNEKHHKLYTKKNNSFRRTSSFQPRLREYFIDDIKNERFSCMILYKLRKLHRKLRSISCPRKRIILLHLKAFVELIVWKSFEALLLEDELLLPFADFNFFFRTFDCGTELQNRIITGKSSSFYQIRFFTIFQTILYALVSNFVN